jgi:hypothetical protein
MFEGRELAVLSLKQHKWRDHALNGIGMARLRTETIKADRAGALGRDAVAVAVWHSAASGF